MTGRILDNRFRLCHFLNGLIKSCPLILQKFLSVKDIKAYNYLPSNKVFPSNASEIITSEKNFLYLIKFQLNKSYFLTNKFHQSVILTGHDRRQNPFLVTIAK